MLSLYLTKSFEKKKSLNSDYFILLYIYVTMYGFCILNEELEPEFPVLELVVFWPDTVIDVLDLSLIHI